MNKEDIIKYVNDNYQAYHLKENLINILVKFIKDYNLVVNKESNKSIITPYRLKHLPTGLYYQPHNRGSNLSKKGKIYQNKINAFSGAMRDAIKNNNFETKIITLYCMENSNIHKQTKEILNWQTTKEYKTLKCETFLKDWIQEKI